MSSNILKLEVGKSYVDFGNSIVNIIHKKRNGAFIGLYQTSERVSFYSLDGTSLESQFSLAKEYVAPKKIKVEFWVNVYHTGTSIIHGTKSNADKLAGNNRLECFHFEKEYEVPG